MFGAGGQFTLRNIPLKTLIGFAYELQDSEIVGTAELLAQLYTMDAQPMVAPSPDRAMEDEQLMVRALLADRFKLAFHWDSKRVPVYALVGKPNAGMKAADTGDSGPYFWGGADSVTGQAVPMDRFIKFLAIHFDRPLLDQTGLSGRYNFTLKWRPEPGDPGARPNSSGPPTSPSASVVIDSVQQQLGLELLPQEADVKRMAVDRVVQPTDLVEPAKAVTIDPAVFDRYVGHYSFCIRTAKRFLPLE